MASGLSLSNMSYTSSPNVDRTSPPNQSISFSISAILSDEVGQKKSPNSSSTFTTPNTSRASTHQPQSGERSYQSISPSSSYHHLQLDTPKRPQTRENVNVSQRKSHISLSDAANMFSSYETSTVQDHPAHPVASFKTSPPVFPHHSSHLTLSTPSRLHTSNPPLSTPSHPHNSSLTLSPFNPTLLHTLSQPAATPTSNKDDMLNDSLGMLSTVALYHSELSSINTTIGTPVQERLANMRLASSSSDSSNPEWSGLAGSEMAESSLGQKSSRKMVTPRILKRDKKRRRQSQMSDSEKGSFSSSDESSAMHTTHFNTGFLSPLAKGNNTVNLQQATFSPSIFLSRPDHTPSPTHPHTVTSDQSEASGSSIVLPTISVLGTASPASDEESVTSDDKNNFATSTPIKGNKENLLRERWSPTILRKGGSRRHLNDTSSGSDSDVAVKRPKKMIVPSAQHHHRSKRSKARTKLSPLLENACSPIAKTDSYHQPSPLATTQLTTTPTRASTFSSETALRNPNTSLPVMHIQQGPSHRHTSQPHTFTAPPPPQQTITSPPPPHPHSFTLSQHMYQPLQPPLMLPRPQIQTTPTYPFIPQTYNCFLPTQMPGTIQSPFFPGLTPSLGITPFFGLSQPFYSNVGTPNFTMANSLIVGPGRTTGSPSTKIQSVPPWFIFANNKSEGKRSRLTEAINKSLSETPAQKPRLPAEWTKLACGQTNDQKMLTESARNFLQCQPRQLTFAAEDDSS